MRPVRVVHDGGGVYRYGRPGQPLGRLQLDPKDFAVAQLQGPGQDQRDPFVTAATVRNCSPRRL